MRRDGDMDDAIYIYVYVRDIAFLRTMAMGEYIPFYCFNSQICASHR